MSGPAAIVIAVVIAVTTAGAAIYFWRGQQTAVARLSAAQAQASRAEQNFKAAGAAVNTIVSAVADGLGDPGVIQVGDRIAILGRVESAVDTLAAKTQSDAKARRGWAVMYVQLSTTYLALGDANMAVASARKGIDIFRALAAAEPDNEDMISDVGLSLEKLADALRANHDFKGALAAGRESSRLRGPWPARSLETSSSAPMRCLHCGGWRRPATIPVSG